MSVNKVSVVPEMFWAPLKKPNVLPQQLTKNIHQRMLLVIIFCDYRLTFRERSVHWWPYNRKFSPIGTCVTARNVFLMYVLQLFCHLVVYGGHFNDVFKLCLINSFLLDIQCSLLNHKTYSATLSQEDLRQFHVKHKKDRKRQKKFTINPKQTNKQTAK